MTPDQVDQLLYENESEALDFKESQYPFSKATDDQKSELLKDILGFANAWRRSDAYILVGVQERRGSKSLVLGVDEHLSDHALQQFVNSKTNQPIQFSYEAISLEGKEIGVVSINQQARPFWLTKDYGRLKKEEVYVRRGSSTDPTKPASPDEIIKMTQAREAETANIEIQFCDPKTNHRLGTSQKISAKFICFPLPKRLPKFSMERAAFDIGNTLRKVNEKYYQDVSTYCHRNNNFHQIQLVITNTSKVSAEDVRVEILLPSIEGLEILEESEIDSSFPQKESFGVYSLADSMAIGTRNVQPSDGDVQILRNLNPTILEVEYKKIQPGRNVFTDKFYIACSQSGSVILSGKVFSKNLPQPVDVDLKIEFAISHEGVELDEFLTWADGVHGR